jgi:hypothetical protein
MGRYVFLHKHNDPDRAVLKEIAATPGLHVIDGEVSRAMLVEADDEVIEKLRPQLSDWVISSEVFYARPKPE